MNDLEYTYAVARIRSLEASLLTDSVIDQLVNCQSEKQCLELLSEKGWVKKLAIRSTNPPPTPMLADTSLSLELLCGSHPGYSCL